jgi:hypothetical protein
VGSQRADEEDDEVPADAEQALVERSRDGEGTCVLRQQCVEHPLERPDVRIDPTLVVHLHAVCTSQKLVEHQSLNRPRQAGDVTRQLGQARLVRSGRR